MGIPAILEPINKQKGTFNLKPQRLYDPQTQTEGASPALSV